MSEKITMGVDMAQKPDRHSVNVFIGSRYIGTADLVERYLSDPHIKYCRDKIAEIINQDRPTLRVRLKPEVKVEWIPSYAARQLMKQWQDSIDQITRMRFPEMVGVDLAQLSKLSS